MVVIHIKRSELEQFLYECTTSDSNDKVIRDLVGRRLVAASKRISMHTHPPPPTPPHPTTGLQCFLWNTRDRIGRLAGAVDELAKHGRMRAEADRGIDEVLEREGKVIEKGPHYSADPLGMR